MTDRLDEITAGRRSGDDQLVGEYLYRRYMLAFRVDPGSLDRRLPAGWQSIDNPGWGNVAAGFCEVLETTGADGAALPDARHCYVPINGPARHADSGEEANFRYVTFADGPDPLTPCALRLLSSSHHRETEARDGRRKIRDSLELTDHAREHVRLEIEHDAAVSLEAADGDMLVRCPEDASVLRRYRNWESHGVIFSDADGIDLRSRFAYRIESPATADLFDGSEQLRAVVVVPGSRRRVSRRLPA